MFQACVVIPVYNHPDSIVTTCAEIARPQLDIILVDDGCDPHCRQVLIKLAETTASNTATIKLVQLAQNTGKGGAVKAGLKYALQLGYSHALQIDADGQHNADDIPRFLQLAKQYPDHLVAGIPIYDQSVPRLRFYARYLTHFWVWVNTLSLSIGATMCGFRVYPLAPSCELLDQYYFGDRMDFDPEFIVKWFWQSPNIHQLATQIRYPDDGISHFKGGLDNWLISKMHTRLFFGMLKRSVSLISRKFQAAKDSNNA
jgi:glycosyltransferase involved in cell wall biosynthesis